jgi:hypothetical protein
MKRVVITTILLPYRHVIFLIDPSSLNMIGKLKYCLWKSSIDWWHDIQSASILIDQLRKSEKCFPNFQPTRGICKSFFTVFLWYHIKLLLSIWKRVCLYFKAVEIFHKFQFSWNKKWILLSQITVINSVNVRIVHRIK